MDNPLEYSAIEASYVDENDLLLRYLYDLEENKNNLFKLLDTFHGSKPTSFVGAGTSLPLGIPNWLELMNELCDLSANSEHYRDKLKNPDNYQEIAEEIYNELSQEMRIDEYYNIIRSRMQQNKNTTSLTLIKMILAIDNHITTNFDTSIESAYNFLEYLSNYYNAKLAKKVTKHYVPKLDYGNDNPSNIYYLHGNILEDIYILKKSEYDLYYPSVSDNENGTTAIEDCLNYFYQYRTIFFIGFSFSDKYIKDYFFQLAQKSKLKISAGDKLYQQSTKKLDLKHSYHFLLIPESNEEWQNHISKYQLDNIVLKKLYSEGFPNDLVNIITNNITQFPLPVSEREFIIQMKNMIGIENFDNYSTSILKHSNMARRFYQLS